MLTSKKTTLRPLLESADGIHLSAYLVNRGDLIDLKRQLKDVINQSYEWLNPVMTAEQRNRFLEPLDSLLHDASIFKQMKGNIGIFRHENLFRVLNIPIAVEPTCQVATSFHVKPLLRWLQEDQEFLLLGIESDSAHLYFGSQDSLKQIDSIFFSDSSREAETMSWVNDWIVELSTQSAPKLFLAGERKLTDGLAKNLKYRRTVRIPIAECFESTRVSDLLAPIRRVLKEESSKLIERALLEFRFADEKNRTQRNIFLIAKAVVRGRVRKLIVANDLSIFGTVDKRTGGLSIHPFDLDHEDDDVLDDLAQMVLSQGGEVVVASRDEIPKGRPILAILDDDGTELSKFEDQVQNI